MSKPKPVYKKNDVFFHREARRFFIVNDAEYNATKNSWLYSLFSPNPEKETPPDWKRCYERDILGKYVPVNSTDSEMVKILYAT